MGKSKKLFAVSSKGIPRVIETPEMIIDCERAIHAVPERTPVEETNTLARHNCMITIESMSDHISQASYEQIWHAAVAVDAICARRGFAGWALGVGMDPGKPYLLKEQRHL